MRPYVCLCVCLSGCMSVNVYLCVCVCVCVLVCVCVWFACGMHLSAPDTQCSSLGEQHIRSHLRLARTASEPLPDGAWLRLNGLSARAQEGGSSPLIAAFLMGSFQTGPINNNPPS